MTFVALKIKLNNNARVGKGFPLIVLLPCVISLCCTFRILLIGGLFCSPSVVSPNIEGKGRHSSELYYGEPTLSRQI